MKSAVVTGANGFVGMELVHELSKKGVNVYAVVRSNNEKTNIISQMNGVEVIQCDMSNIELLADKIKEMPEVFFHLAWQGSTGADRADYALQLKNANWTIDAVNVAHALGCRRFIGAGTLAEYDVNAYSPVNGSTPNAVSCYGVAKIGAHYMSKAECNRLGLDHLWAYLSNTYGIGNYTNNFVNFAAKSLITGKSADFTAGEQPYDFVYVTDTAKGLSCIAEKGKKNYSYYIGSNQSTQLKNFVKAIRDEVDPEIQLNLGAIPFNGLMQPASTFDCTSLMNDTGYKPEVSFKDGIKVTVKWLREQIEEGKI